MGKARVFKAEAPVFRVVLVTSDFSNLANRAIPYACALLRRGGRLLLLNVQHPRALPEGEYQNEQWTPEALRRHRRHLAMCRQRLQRLIPVSARPRGINAEALVLTGWKVPATICAEAARRGADVICLGSHGYTGVKAGLLGSVARAVLARSDFPVLVVRNPD